MRLQLVMAMMLTGAALAIGCVSPAPSAAESPISPLDDSSTARPRIVVTFIDRSINRVPFEGPGTGYRPRGGYQNTTWSRRISNDLAEEYKLREVVAWPISTLGVQCVVYEVPSGQPLSQLLGVLAHDQRIESAQRMNRFRVLSDPYSRVQTALQSMRINSAHRLATGRNVTIAMVDTGVDYNHPDLIGQILETEDFVTNDPSVFTDDIHGTAVAGAIVAHGENGTGIIGIAPDAKLIALKACWAKRPQSAEAVCDTLSLARALDAAIRLAPQVLNLSLTGPSDSLLEKLIDEAIKRGIVVVAANPEMRSRSNNFPTSLEGVVRVSEADSFHSSTAYPADPRSLIAPGSEVLTTFPHGTYNFISGSSMAAAHVSGIVALLLELKPTLSSAQLINIMQTTAAKSIAYKYMRSKSSTIVDACAALAKLRGIHSCLQG